jgi:hypothetical protein
MTSNASTFEPEFYGTPFQIEKQRIVLAQRDNILTQRNLIVDSRCIDIIKGETFDHKVLQNLIEQYHTVSFHFFNAEAAEKFLATLDQAVFDIHDGIQVVRFDYENRDLIEYFSSQEEMIDKKFTIEEVTPSLSKNDIAYIQSEQVRYGLYPFPGYFLRSIYNDTYTLAVRDTETGDIVASTTFQHCSCYNNLDEKDFSIVRGSYVHEAYRNQNLGKYLNACLGKHILERFNIRSAYSYIYNTNIPSFRMVKSLGVKLVEGHTDFFVTHRPSEQKFMMKDATLSNEENRT